MRVFKSVGRLSIKTKLTISVVGIILVLVSVLGVSSIFTNRTAQLSQAIQTDSLPEVIVVSQLAYGIQRVKSNIRELFLSKMENDKKDLMYVRGVIFRNLAAITAEMANWQKIITVSSADKREEKAEFASVAPGVKAFVELTNKVVLLVENEGVAPAINFFKTQLEELSRTLQRQIQVIMEHEYKEIQSFSGRMSDTAQLLDRSLRTFLILVAGLVILLGLYFLRDVEKNAQTSERYQIILDQSPVSVVMTDLQGHITYVNKKFESLTGYSMAEVMGQNPRILKSGLQSGKFYQHLWDTLGAGKVWQGKFSNMTKGGQHYWEEAIISPVLNYQGNPEAYMAIKMDVTERKQLQDRLVQSSKLASIGTLASGVAHELNNPLAVVLGETQLVLKQAGLTVGTQERLNKVAYAAERMKKIINRLRNFARQGKDSDSQALDINQVISETLTLLEKQFALDGVKLKTDLGKEAFFVWGIADQLESVFQNLLTNAAHALETVADQRAKIITLTCQKQTDGVVISIMDNGSGIAPRDLPKIFDPFYTTKETGKGTGLGLSIIYDIIKKHRGTINVASQVGEGTTFTLTFPTTQAALKINKPSLVVVERPVRATKPRILIIDDEPEVAEIVQDFLAEAYSTTVETTSQQALMMIKKQTFDLILTDSKMPKGSAVDIVAHANKWQPLTPVIIMSGYGPNDDGVKAAIAEGGVGYIAKPFTDGDQLIKDVGQYLTDANFVTPALPT